VVFFQAEDGIRDKLVTGVQTCALPISQEEGWQIQRGDYGFKNQRSDVTDILKDLIERGGVNGRVAVNNQTMGGDPAVGKDKSLRSEERRVGKECRTRLWTIQ